MTEVHSNPVAALRVVIAQTMSVQSPSPDTDSQLSPKAQTLVEYLRDEVTSDGGEIYVKGKFISDDVGLTPKEIGQLMVSLQDVVQDLEIEKWSYTSATTWRIASIDTQEPVSPVGNTAD